MSVMSATCASPPSDFRQPQRDAAQMEPMRILAQPVVKFVLPFGAYRVTDLTAISVELNQAQRLRIESRRQRRAMPSPLRHRAERGRLFVNFGKVCNPVTSAVNATPFPTDNGDNGSNCRNTGS